MMVVYQFQTGLLENKKENEMVFNKRLLQSQLSPMSEIANYETIIGILGYLIR